MEDKYNNTGGLWKRKPKTDENGKNIDDPTKSYPDYDGSINVDGKMKKVAAWINSTKEGGQPDINLRISEPQAKQ